MDRETIGNVLLIILGVIFVLAVVAMLIGLGFEAVKWLGHTQK